MSDWQNYWANKAVDGGNSTNLRPEYYDTSQAVEHLKEIMGDVSGSLLDVGCGNGLTLFYLKQYFTNLTGIDYSDNLINWDKEYLSHIAQFIQADGRNIPFRNNSFDAVISIAAIQYMEIKEDGIKMVDEMVRVCRPGGVVVVADVLDKAEYLPENSGMRAYMPDELANGRQHLSVKSFFEPDRRFDLIIRK